MATVRVQAEAFDAGAELAALLAGRADVGGVGAFVGIVRNAAGGRPLRALTLEHYPGMTERALARIAAERGHRPLADDAVAKIAAGITSFAEVERVVGWWRR